MEPQPRVAADAVPAGAAVRARRRAGRGVGRHRSHHGPAGRAGQAGPAHRVSHLHLLEAAGNDVTQPILGLTKSMDLS